MAPKSHRDRVLSLYRRILHLHNFVLPIDARIVGDVFVKFEFAQHKDSPQHEAFEFIRQWENYSQELSLNMPALGEESHSQAFVADIGVKPHSSVVDETPRWATPKPIDYFTKQAPEHPMHVDARQGMPDEIKPLIYPFEPQPMNPSDVSEEAAYARLRNIAKPLDPHAVSTLNLSQKDTLSQFRESIINMNIDPSQGTVAEIQEFGQEMEDNPEHFDKLKTTLRNRQIEYNEESKNQPLVRPLEELNEDLIQKETTRAKHTK